MGVTFYLATLLSPHVMRDPIIRQAAVRQLLVIPLGKSMGPSLKILLLTMCLPLDGITKLTADLTANDLQPEPNQCVDALKVFLVI